MATENGSPSGHSLYVAILNALVKLFREYTGRGPMKARTTIRENVVVVLMEQNLTKGEQLLVQRGRHEQVLAPRHQYQEAIREESSRQGSGSPAGLNLWRPERHRR